MPRTDVSLSLRPPAPRHRATPVPPAPDGRVAWGLAWKVCAFLPMVLLFVGLGVRLVGGGGDASSPEAAPNNDTSAYASTVTGQAPIVTTADRKQKQRAAKSSESPSASASTSPEASPATSEPSDEPTRTPSPTKKPTTSPTPDEAREQCLREGGNLATLAECIARKMGD